MGTDNIHHPFDTDIIFAIMGDIRVSMRRYWEEQCHSQVDLPEEADEEEIAEITSLLPDLHGKNVVELGAGTGRFTGILSKSAKHVTAVDFIKEFTDKNQSSHRADHITFKCCDVTNGLEIPEQSVDLVFCNWLLMYLSDDEVRQLLQKALTWLKPDGKLFFRESCFHQSGNQKDRTFNPTIYRYPADYMSLIESVSVEEGEDSTGYELIMSRSIQAYVRRFHNTNQICWLFTKVKFDHGHNHGFQTFQQFLDAKQYSRNGILRYEKIFGRHFVSTGGKGTTEEFVDMLDLQAGQAVLDVGAGIGGSAFYMAEKYDVTVLGYDLSANMINIALERANEIKDYRVQFEIADATKRVFPSASYDVVYSRDTILHIKDKKSLFASFYDCLKPGGKLLISDYSCSEGEHSEVFKAYVKQRGYHLLPVKDYGKVLESVGFVNVNAMDRTDQFINVLKSELEMTEKIKDDFIKEFSEADYAAIVDGWKDKLHRVGMGNQKWGLFYAEKPAQTQSRG